MAGETGEGIYRYRKRAGTDCDMRLGHAHDIEQQRRRKNGAATADQPKRKPDKRSRSQRGADHRDHGRAPFIELSGEPRSRGALMAADEAAIEQGPLGQ
jgi:hypothetical protein